MASGTSRLLNILRRRGAGQGQLDKMAGATDPGWDGGGAANKKAGGFDSGWPGDGGPGIQYRGGGMYGGRNSSRGRGKGVMGRYMTRKNRGY